MGGLVRSLSILENARLVGVNMIIGAQVGETSILTRAALTLANQGRDILLAQEGAFGTYLLKDDICEEPLMFAEGGKLLANNMSGHGRQGFGLSVKASYLQ